MLIKCPSCGEKLRLMDSEYTDDLVRYFCKQCEQIVLLDLNSDKIPTSSSAPTAKTTHHTFRILVADDTLPFIRVVEDLLTKEGFVVITAHDGVEALKKVTDERPDAIVLDLFMPRMTGFEVLKALKTNPHYKPFRHIPVLVTSGVYKPAEIELIHDLGANGFISKEAVQESLIYRLKKLLPASPANA